MTAYKNETDTELISIPLHNQNKMRFYNSSLSIKFMSEQKILRILKPYLILIKLSG